MKLILTPPPKVMVILKEISFNYGSPAEICYWININELEFNHDKTDILLIHLRCHHKPPVDQ